MEAELRTLEECYTVNIHADALESTLKKYQSGKPLTLMAYTDFGFKKIHLYPQQTCNRNEQMHTEN